MEREIDNIKVKIKDDENYKKYKETIEINRKKLQEMKENGIINIDKIFKMGVEIGILSKNLNMDLEVE